MKIVIAGGNGYLGQKIASHYQKAHEVVVLTRGEAARRDGVKYVHWDAHSLDHWQSELEGADVLLNLAGKSVNCRYTVANKREITASRVKSTRVLQGAIERCTQAPKLWMNASSATIYRSTMAASNDETSEVNPSNFSEHVCADWEAAFFEKSLPNTRKLALRMALVLGNSGGVLPAYQQMVRQGLGGTQGSGKQYVSWVHENDLLAILDFTIATNDLEGVVNCAAPQPVPNQNFMKAVRKAINVRFGLRVYTWMTGIGAFLKGTEKELILKSRRVLSKTLAEKGFKFKFTHIDDALSDLAT